MRQRSIGGVEVGAIGLGGVHWSLPQAQDESQSIRTIHAALDAGVTLIDTALAYTTLEHESHNESLVAKALASYAGDTSDVLVATKGGHRRTGPAEFPKDGRPESIRRDCEISLRTLGVEAIGLYQLHWPDPSVAVTESLGAFADLQREGKVRMIGVSNFSVAQLDEVAPIANVMSVQNPFNPARRGDADVIGYAARKGIAFLPYSPLGGQGGAGGIGERHPQFAKVAAERGVSPQQIVLAWHLAQSPTVVPIPGARRPATITDSVQAADIDLTDEELAVLDGG